MYFAATPQKGIKRMSRQPKPPFFWPPLELDGREANCPPELRGTSSQVGFLGIYSSAREINGK